MNKKLSENELISLINQEKVIGIYSENDLDASLLSLSCILELNYFDKNCNLIYISKEEENLFYQRFLSILYKKDLNTFNQVKKNKQLYNDFRFKNLKGFKKILLNNNDYLNYSKTSQIVDKYDKNIVFIRNIDKIIEGSFFENGHLFLKYFKDHFPNSILIYDFSLSILGEFAKENNKMFCIRSNNPDLRFEDYGTRDQYILTKEEDPIFSLKFKQKYELNNLNKCTCGAIKTYGKLAKKSYLYHSDHCDLII
jgi:hypothetical protein